MPFSADTVDLAEQQLNVELNDLLIHGDEEVEYIDKALERVRRQATAHYLHVRANGGDQNHWRVGPNPLQNVQLAEGVSVDYVKTVIQEEVRNCHCLLRLLLTPSPIARTIIGDDCHQCRRAYVSVLQEDGAFWLRPPGAT